MTLPSSTDVLIVGAGPTGLALAIALQKAGVDYLLIDKLAEGANTSRAAVIHAHTLEALDELGVSERLVQSGLKLTTFAIRDRDRVAMRLRFDALPTPHRYLLMLPQDLTEKILAERLAELGGAAHRNVTALAVTQSEEFATASVATADGERRIKARYIVGADGMRSVVRAAAGVDFAGDDDEASFILADVRMDWPLGRDEVMLFFSQAGLMVVAPLPDGRFRIVATLDPAPEQATIADIQAIVDARGPTKTRAVVREVVWSSRFRLHHRLANAYRDRRLLIMGDAAHVHSPAGGQGMNTGLVDATVLGRLLADVALGRRPDAALDQYQALRRPAAAQVLELAGRLTWIATMRNPLKRWLRNLILSIIDKIAPMKRAFAMNLSGLSRRDQATIAN